MQYTIKTLLSQGKSYRHIARTLGISRGTVKRIAGELKAAEGQVKAPSLQRPFKAAAYEEQITTWLGQDLSPKLIWQRLRDQGVKDLSYSSLWRYIRHAHGEPSEVYIPLLADPGQEGQVDFGYLGYFDKDGARVKVWVFCMVLSYSRYAYYREVTDQSVPTFLRCHAEAFRFFGGVPATVKIDNLKAGVLAADFYEPAIQHQYAQLLAHYGSAPITARIRRGQDKGKVEAGVKYVKGNFLKGLDHSDYSRMSRELAHWNTGVCNQRLHGTTRKVPAEVFTSQEQAALLPLPATDYEITDIGSRKVNSLAHIYFGYNYYSVPHTLVGHTLRTESNGRLLRLYEGESTGTAHPVAVHAIAGGKGQFITIDAHKPPQKRAKSDEHYLQGLAGCGPSARALGEQMQKDRPHHWKVMSRGILALVKRYGKEVTEASCSRALAYGVCSYQSVRRICEQGLYQDQPQTEGSDQTPVVSGGYGHDLSIYDNLF